MSGDEPTMGAVMVEFRHVNEKLDAVIAGQEKITHELAGNGGPGLRTRVHAVETGEQHLKERQEKVENKADENERRVLSLTNMMKGAAVLLLALEALRWLVPLLQTP